jgi:hypothetical protein
MKTYWKWRQSSALYGREWSASRPGRFTPRETAPDTHCIWDWVGPRADLDAVEKRTISSPARNCIPAFQAVARHYTDWAISALWRFSCLFLIHFYTDRPYTILYEGLHSESQKYLHAGREKVSLLIKKSHTLKLQATSWHGRFSNDDSPDVASRRKCTINMLVLPQDTVRRKRIRPPQQANVFLEPITSHRM